MWLPLPRAAVSHEIRYNPLCRYHEWAGGYEAQTVLRWPWIVELPRESSVSLEETIATHLRQRGWHLALAETTTGGIIAVRLVRLAGSSAYFDRSIVAYSKEAKLQSLGVDPGVFERHGSVSIETACAMAEGLHRLSQADMVLAETGIAGPIRGRSPKPLGTTCFAMRTPTGMC